MLAEARRRAKHFLQEESRPGGWSGMRGNSTFPIAAWAATAVMVGGLEGRSFTFREIGDMIADSFLMALQSLAATLTQFRETVRGIFG